MGFSILFLIFAVNISHNKIQLFGINNITYILIKGLNQINISNSKINSLFNYCTVTKSYFLTRFAMIMQTSYNKYIGIVTKNSVNRSGGVMIADTNRIIINACLR